MNGPGSSGIQRQHSAAGRIQPRNGTEPNIERWSNGAQMYATRLHARARQEETGTASYASNHTAHVYTPRIQTRRAVHMAVYWKLSSHGGTQDI
ncbi:hypothetical protein NPIL_137411 [Nephila pilipes]|uniref:Uncharacterized protein n=1 Tax=Nephila pilipes TaxID=299642 RepID=A0A8X6PF16_NEPPI|nr:hypothetical protein NPIL_137411 [Nephila pilipes]